MYYYPIGIGIKINTFKKGYLINSIIQQQNANKIIISTLHNYFSEHYMILALSINIIRTS